jgi:hypothetical protein
LVFDERRLPYEQSLELSETKRQRAKSALWDRNLLPAADTTRFELGVGGCLLCVDLSGSTLPTPCPHRIGSQQVDRANAILGAASTAKLRNLLPWYSLNGAHTLASSREVCVKFLAAPTRDAQAEDNAFTRSVNQPPCIDLATGLYPVLHRPLRHHLISISISRTCICEPARSEQGLDSPLIPLLLVAPTA